MGNAASFPRPLELPEKARRDVLDGKCTIEGIADLIQNGKAKKIIVLMGAGASVSAGIPDFRSPTTGLYSQLSGMGLPCPEAIFHIGYFQQNPGPFYKLAREMFPGRYHPTDAHFFCSLLNKKGLLLRHYTQNVDNLECLAGIPSHKLVEAHGSFADVHCLKCHQQYPLQWFRDQLNASDNAIPRCPKKIKRPQLINCHCTNTKDQQHSPSFSSPSGSEFEGEKALSAQIKKMTLQDETDVEVRCHGLIKPDIVFFGEALPKRFEMLSEIDFKEADLMIVLGTSLQVYPFAGLLSKVSEYVPRLLINREYVGISDDNGADGKFLFFDDHNYRDVAFIGTCDEGVRALSKMLGWESELNSLKREYHESGEANWERLAKQQLLEKT